MADKFSITQTLDDFIERPPLILGGIIREAQKRVYEHSQEEMLSIGREYISNADYLEAMIVFHEIGKTGGRMRTLAREFYEPIIFTIAHSNEKIHKPIDDILADELVYCMMESTRMYSEKDMSKEELFEIESLIDKVDFGNMHIKEREEFERIYCKFKEYCILNVYLENGEKK